MKRLLLLFSIIFFVHLTGSISKIYARVDCGDCTTNSQCGSGYRCDGNHCCVPQPTSPPQPTDVPTEPVNLCTGNPNSPNCTAPDGTCCSSPNFAVCNKSGDPWVWDCTGTSGCTDPNAWSAWSPASCTAPDIQTRYCTDASCCGTTSEAQTCPPNVSDPIPTPGGPPINMYNCRTDVDPNPNNSYTCLATSSTYPPTTGGINQCQANLAVYVVNPYPGGSPMSTGICYTTKYSTCALNCCRQIYRCQNDGTCAQTTNTYYSNDGPGNPGFLDCTNGLASTCTQNLQNLVTPPNNVSCYATLATCQASCAVVAPPTPPVPSPSCGTYNVGTTPVTWGWSPIQASGLQVWDDTAQWWFNSWTTSPHTDASIPAGRTVYGRTTYDFTTFSSIGSITCPIPPATIQVRGVSLSSTPQTCGEITASTAYRTGSVFDVTRNGTSIGQQTQSGSTYLSWINTAGTYTVSSVEAPTSVVQYCRTQSGTSTFGSSSVTAVADSITTFDVSFSPYEPWFQVRGGGDVYAGGRLVSSIPASATTRRFILDDGPAGSLFPGMALYGSTNVIPYDFDQASTSQGETIVSSKNWLVSHQNTTVDLYSMFYAKFGSPTTADYTNPASPIAKPASRATPYYISGDLTTTGDWSVGNGEQLILLVDGSITVGGEMHTSGTGVIIVVTKNDILFAPAVGVSVASSTPSIEGVYIAGNSLHTGVSTSGSERFVGSGMFIANAVSLERDLSSAGGNQATASELFIYDPSFLINLPEAMKDTSVSWQEVAP